MKTILFALCAGLMVQTTLPTVPQVNPTGLLGVNGTEHTGGAMAVSGTASGAVTDSGSGTEPADPVMDSETVPTEAAAGPEIAAPSALLMEASTGQVIYEKNADEKRSPEMCIRDRFTASIKQGTRAGSSMRALRHRKR